jgi:cell division septation protein DedD
MDFLKQRLLGAAFLLSLAIAFIPVVFSGESAATLTSQYTDVNAHPYQVALNKQLNRESADLQGTQSSREISYTYASSEDTKAWSIRVGSFSDPLIAQQLEQKLQQQGYEAYLQSSDGSLYNVMVGPELAASNAQVVQKQLQQQLQLKGVVVPYEPIMYVQNDVQRG